MGQEAYLNTDEAGSQPKRFHLVRAPRLVHDAVIATLVFSTPPEMDMEDIFLTPRIVFGETMEPQVGLAVIESLDVLESEIRIVIDAFDREFSS